QRATSRQRKRRPSTPGGWRVTPASPPQCPDPDTRAGRAVAPPPAALARSAERWDISTKAELATRTWAPSFKSRGPHPLTPCPRYHGFLMVSGDLIIALLA